MTYFRFISLIILLVANPSLAAVPDGFCNSKLTANQPTISDSANNLYLAIKEKSVGLSFPPIVDGKSLIPLKILFKLREHLLDRPSLPNGETTKEPLNLLEISAITLETWHKQHFNIVIHYKDTKYKKPKVLGSSYRSILLWYTYLRAGIKDPNRFVTLDINHLPTPPNVRVDQHWKRVKDGKFNTERTLKDYRNSFGDDFTNALRQLQSSDTWIDMGAGHANAITEFLTKRIKRDQEPPATIAVGYTFPGGEFHLQKLYHHLNATKFQYIEGRQTLKTLAKFPQANIITDVMGIYTYHSNPLEVFKRYVSILKPGGKIFIESYNFQEIAPYLEQNPQLSSTLFGYDGSIMIQKR